MKLYFGLPNAGLTKTVSPALEAMGIKMLKASPAMLNMKGLYTRAQPGYSEYADNLPAYIEATCTGKNLVIGAEGYGCSVKPEHVLPIAYPPFFISPKNKTAFKDTVKVMEGSEAGGSNTDGYFVPYGKGRFQRLSTVSRNSKEYVPGGATGIDDYGAIFLISAIISGFLRTHSYPAFKKEDFPAYCPIPHADMKGTKHVYTPDDKDVDKHLGKILRTGDTYGTPRYGEIVKTYDAKAPLCAYLSTAKPNQHRLETWFGGIGDAPYENAICFPFVPELAVWDKDTVPEMIGQFFLRSLGTTTESCLQMYSTVCRAWKRSIWHTVWGDSMSHLCKVISLAIPAQAHVFPIIENDVYKGCVLSGYNFSVANGRDIYRPSIIDEDDRNGFTTNATILDKIAKLLSTDDSLQEQIVAEGLKGMRYLDERIRDFHAVNPEQTRKLRDFASRLRYKKDFLRVNMDNISAFIDHCKRDVLPDKDLPMHVSGLLRLDPMGSFLSAFGPLVPSPSAPQGRSILIDGKEPENLNGLIVFKQTSLETAISDWLKMSKEKKILNGVMNLQSRFQHVPVKGKHDREAFFMHMKDFIDWSVSVQGNSAGIGGVASSESSKTMSEGEFKFSSDW